MPNNDFKEQDRLSLQHQVFVQALQGRLTTTRLLPSTRRILDLGTGPGHWAVAIALQYPRSEVVGIDMTEWDLNTTEATLGETKVTWQLDDLDVWGQQPDVDDLTSRLGQFDFFAEPSNRKPLETSASSRAPAVALQSEAETSIESLVDPDSLIAPPQPGWHFSEAFELIHLRNMKGVFAHWEEVYAEIFKSLSPGGWIEVADYDLGQLPLPPSETQPSSHLPMPTLRKIYAAIVEASFKAGRPLGTFYMHPSYLEEAGFTDVQTTHVNVPIGQWHADEKQRSIGKLMLVVMMETFEASSLRLLTQTGDKNRKWTVEEVKAHLKVAQREVTEYVERAERGEVEGWCASFKWITGRRSWHD
jgi:SAM-dependent methyltransferase